MPASNFCQFLIFLIDKIAHLAYGLGSIVLLTTHHIGGRMKKRSSRPSWPRGYRQKQSPKTHWKTRHKRGVGSVALYSEHHIVPRARDFFDWQSGDANRVRVICDEWHRFRWHRQFGNALPSEVVSVLMACAERQAKDPTVLITRAELDRLLLEQMVATDCLVQHSGRTALQIHLDEMVVSDLDLDFSQFSRAVRKNLDFLFGPDLRSVRGIHRLLLDIFPAKSRRKISPLALEDIYHIAWHHHQLILTRRQARVAAK